MARELWRKSFRSFGQRSKGAIPFVNEGNMGRECCLHIGFAFPAGFVTVCWASAWISLAPHHCVLTLGAFPASRCSRIACLKLVVSQRLQSFTRILVRWLWLGLESLEGQWRTVIPTPQALVLLQATPWAQQMSYYNPDVLKVLGDSEAAQQAEESPTRSQMARVGRRIWRIGGRMECNHAVSKVCRIDFCDRLALWGYSQNILLRLQVGYERRSLSSWWASQHLNC